ncbi:MAG: GTP 3',8-cyclase MoaA [Gemmatimonadota bacterium]|nr:MAG: GTP 3',8-cyclase MoaA [Gemmatimonadota bacterium]
MAQPSTPTPVADALGRPLQSLRVSVTDRCNLRCRYCMPEEEYVWLPRQSILSYEETERLVRVFGGLGVAKVRITGGEPLLRRDLVELVAALGANPSITDLALTTNGLLLSRHAGPLREAGLGRITVSLDTLRPERFQEFARGGRLADVMAGLDALGEAGFAGSKLNVVVVRGFNDDEIVPLLEFGRVRGLEVRFIEYMDVGGATRWSPDDVVPRAEMLARLGTHFGSWEPVPEPGDRAPAERFTLPDGTVFGIVASTTEPFCRTCGRSRLTADGMWLRCLYADAGTDLKKYVREGATDEELADVIAEAWRGRSDRGAEERLAVPNRGPLYRLERLRRDPHREMHTRGG